jgi:hypothetical protein
MRCIMPSHQEEALLPVTWTPFMAFSFLFYALYHYYFQLYVLFHKSESAFGYVFNAETCQLAHPPRGIREHTTIQEHQELNHQSPTCRLP